MLPQQQQHRPAHQFVHKQHHQVIKPLHLSSSRCRATKEVTTATTEVPAVSFAPTRVRVQHDTYIRASRAAVWALLQEVTPARRWSQVAVVLATLEAIYGVEYQGLAQQLLTAYQATSRTPNAAAATVGALAGSSQQRQQQQGISLVSQANGKQATAAAAAGAGGGRTATAGGASDESIGPWDHLHGTTPSLTSLASLDWADASSSSNGDTGSSLSSVDSDSGEPAQQLWRQAQMQQQEQQQQLESIQLGGVALVPQAAAAAAAAAQAVAAGAAQHEQHGDNHLSSSSSSNDSVNSLHQAAAAGTSAAAAAPAPAPAVPVAAAAAAAAATADAASMEFSDAVFMQLLLLLASKAGFVGLSERDVQLGISLNTDYLWQLFVKVNTEQLDGQLVSPFVQQDMPNAIGYSAADVDGKDTPAWRNQVNEHNLLVLRRGYSSEQQRGRWLIQKLDYLQLLLLKRAYTGLVAVGSHTAQQLKAITAAVAAPQHSSSSSSSSTGASRRRKQTQVTQGSSRRQVVSNKVSRDGAAAKAAQLAAPTAASRRRGSNDSSRSSSSSSGGRGSSIGWLGLRWGRKQSGKGDFVDNAAARTDSFGRPYPNKTAAAAAAAGAAAKVQQHAHPAAAELAASSNSSSSIAVVQKASNGRQTSKAMVAANPGNGSSSSSSDAEAAGAAAQDMQQADHQQDEQQQQQHQQQQQQRRQRPPSILARLRSNIEDSLCRAAYTLSDWGLIPRMDVIPLERFESVFPLTEAPRLQPLYIEKATLPDILDPVLQARFPWLGASGSGSRSSSSGRAFDLQSTAADGGMASTSSSISLDGGGVGSEGSSGRGLLQTFVQQVDIVEPTFRQLLVVYRRKPRIDRWRRLRERVTGKADTTPSGKRELIQLQVYRDIPLPSWQVVYPDKLLQFRPLDLLRLDLFGLAGAGAALAQAKYNSIVLQLLTLVTLGVWATRLVLGYLRMDDRYKSIVAQLLADRTVASGEGGLEYIATAAGLQQFKQTALAYVLLNAADMPCGEEEVAVAAETLLQQKLQLQVRFNAAEALSELKRFGLLVQKPQRSGSSRAASPTASMHAAQWPTAATADGGGSGAQLMPGNDAISQQQQQQPEEVSGLRAVLGQLLSSGRSTPEQQQEQQQQQQLVLYSVLGSSRSIKVLQQYWAGLLKARVGSILSETGMPGDGRGLDDDSLDHLT